MSIGNGEVLRTYILSAAVLLITSLILILVWQECRVIPKEKLSFAAFFRELPHLMMTQQPMP
jgi:hypothetical protein